MKQHDVSVVTRPGFTLVEVLLVVSIIVILISILLPSLTKAREISRRAVCAQGLHQVGIGFSTYANDNGDAFPIGAPIDPDDTFSPYPVWAKTAWADTNATFLARNNRLAQTIGKYRSHGALIPTKYIDDPRVFYCPSWRKDGIQYGGSSAAATDNGWPTNNDPDSTGTEFIETSYHYRSSFGFKNGGRGGRNLRLSNDPATRAVMADHFTDPDKNVDFHHADGYNVLYMDLHASYRIDRNHAIRDYAGAGISYATGGANYEKQEEVWDTLLEEQ